QSSALSPRREAHVALLAGARDVVDDARDALDQAEALQGGDDGGEAAAERLLDGGEARLAALLEQGQQAAGARREAAERGRGAGRDEVDDAAARGAGREHRQGSLEKGAAVAPRDPGGQVDLARVQAEFGLDQGV